MKVRLAKKSDYKEVMKLYNLFVGENRYKTPKDDSFNKVVGSKTGFIHIAEENGVILGYATLSIHNVVRYPKPIAVLDELYVIRKARKQGVGKSLMIAAIGRAKSKGCQRFYIDSHFKHKTAHKFYKNLGFVSYGYHFVKDL